MDLIKIEKIKQHNQLYSIGVLPHIQGTYLSKKHSQQSTPHQLPSQQCSTHLDIHKIKDRLTSEIKRIQLSVKRSQRNRQSEQNVLKTEADEQSNQNSAQQRLHVLQMNTFFRSRRYMNPKHTFVAFPKNKILSVRVNEHLTESKHCFSNRECSFTIPETCIKYSKPETRLNVNKLPLERYSLSFQRERASIDNYRECSANMKDVEQKDSSKRKNANWGKWRQYNKTKGFNFHFKLKSKQKVDTSNVMKDITLSGTLKKMNVHRNVGYEQQQRIVVMQGKGFT